MVALGNPIRAVASARGYERVLFRVIPWNAADEAGATGPPVHEEEVAVKEGLAVWQPATTAWDSGRYVLSLHAADEARMVTFDLNARSRIAVPWGLSDSFDAESPGAVSATLGEQWLRAGDHERARDLFEDALAENPNLGRARLALGRFALDDSDPRAAVRFLEPALAQAPEDAIVLRVLGDAHRESGNHARAAELYERSLPLQAADPSLLNALAWSLAATGESARAIPYLEQSLSLLPEQPEVRELLATLRSGSPPGSPVRQPAGPPLQDFKPFVRFVGHRSGVSHSPPGRKSNKSRIFIGVFCSGPEPWHNRCLVFGCNSFCGSESFGPLPSKSQTPRIGGTMRKSTFALLLAASLALPALAFGQGGDSSIRGTVTDDSGAVLPGVTITATSSALIAAEVTVTDSQGGYRLLNLPVGTFTIEASLPGFATYRQEGLLVRASTNIGVDVVMSISSVEETITVTAETPMLEIARPGNILTIEGEFQRDLPIQARGNWSDFLEMTPGVNARPFDDGSGRMVYFGHATEHFSHVIQIEGMAAAGYNDAQITYVGMGADVIEDASVKTGGAEAKDPMGTGLIINIITRSGGNEVTGSAAYDHQEYDWGTGDDEGLHGFLGDNELPDNFDPFASEKSNFAAMGVFDPPADNRSATGTPTAHQVHQADFSLGGPIMQDKAWFFATYRYADLAARISRSGLDVGFLRDLSGIPLASGLGTAPTYSEFPNTTQSHQPYAKFTAQLNPNHELSAYYQRDQLNNTSNREYDLAPRFLVKTGGDLFGAKLTSVFGTNTTGQFLASWNNKAAEVDRASQPQFDQVPLSVEIHNGFTVNSSGTTGDGGRIAALGTGDGTVRPTRLLLLRADMTHYLDNVAGSHEIAFGVYAAPWNRYPQTRVYADVNGWRTERHAPVTRTGWA